MDGEVLIVDEHTGRMLPGRRYNDGLHQAIEAKEGVEVREEYQTLATVTLQNYFRLYEKLSGMTGTAMTEASRVRQDLQARRGPDPDQQADGPRRPARPRLPHRGGQVRRRRRRHRRAPRARASRSWSAPSRSRSPSTCPSMLRKRGIPHSVLNAKVHADEAKIVAHGRPQGRGHGRHQHGRSRHRHHARWLRGVPRRRRSCASGPRADRRERRGVRGGLARRRSRRIKAQVAAEHDEVKDVGGLYVVGTERHESRRIDNQLRGRSGRQGDPGESRFYLSLEDELMRLFKSDWVDRVLPGPQDPRRRPDREQAGHRRDRQRPGPGRGAELRVPQERPQVRRRDGPPAPGDLRRAPRGARGRRPRRSRSRSFIDDVVEGYVTGATEGFAEEWDLDALLDRAQAAVRPLSLDLNARGRRGRRRRGTRPRRR